MNYVNESNFDFLFVVVKFIYSEKVTKFCAISTAYDYDENFAKFGAFSEYLIFKRGDI